MRHLSFRSAAATLSGKKKERTAKEEAKYQLAFENEQRSKRELDELQISYNGALARVCFSIFASIVCLLKKKKKKKKKNTMCYM